jgi:stage II sporulation protein D
VNTYLQGVLAGEMPTSWPIEALKAQAVSARTYTLFEMNERRREPYQVEAGILDQAFSEPANETQRLKVKQAIDETKDLVLTQKGRVIKAYYHSDCGGQTEDPHFVWGTKVDKRHPQSVADDQCALNPQSKWAVEMTLDEVREKLLSLHSDLGDIDDVRVASRTPSGRADLIALSENGEQQALVSGNEFRRAIGFMKIRSTLFNIQVNEKSVIFSGRGFGHGSGLCQWGSKFLAEKGMGVKEILKHYYPTASLSSEVHVADR